MELTKIAEPLLAWYDQKARVLPWRSFPTPYRVWVSEIMLQQTRVDTVLPYFERFLDTLPDIAALALAPEEVLLKLWEGLGYYSRARNLQRAARIVAARFGGELPSTRQQLTELPGIGDYTAGAIASIAFNLPEEAVDGNVLRVLSRLLASHADIVLPEVKQQFRTLVRGIIPQDRPGDFNQALMDLGATVCLPNGEPHCNSCPLSTQCVAYLKDIAESLPVKKVKKPRDIQRRTVFVLLHNGTALLVRRPSKGLLAGLWELPSAPGWLEETEARDALRQLGATVHGMTKLEGAKHIFTHLEWHMKGWLAEVEAFSPTVEHLWAASDALRETVTLPSAFSAYKKYLPK
jgi:A/G-specific adenine glycosylase